MILAPNFLEEILVVVVLYQQRLTDSKTFISLTQNAATISGKLTFLVFDNSKDADSIPNMRNVEIIYQHHPANLGVSAAYNEGYRIALTRKKKWLLLTDQDTDFPKRIISEYQLAIQQHSHIHLFAPVMKDRYGIISPFSLLGGKGVRIKKMDQEIYPLKRFKIINSGLLISLEAFERSGGYDERFPVDYSDISFIDRVVKNDREFCLVKTTCFHNFSDSNERSNLSDMLSRFELFCKAVRLYKTSSDQSVLLAWIILPHALKLSIKMRRLLFLRIGLRNILIN